MRGTVLALGLLVAVGGDLGQAEAVSYSGRLSHSGANADGQLFIAGPDWNSSYVDATLGWAVDNVTTPGRWHYVYTLEVPGSDRRADIQCVIVETADGNGGRAFTALDLFSPVSVPEDWLVAVQVGLFVAGTQRGLPGDLYGVEFATPTQDPTTLTISFDSDRGPTWGDLYARSFMVCEVSNVLYNTGLLSLNPADMPRSGSVGSHVLVPGTVTSVFLIPAPAGVFLAFVGAGLVGWLRRHQCLMSLDTQIRQSDASAGRSS